MLSQTIWTNVPSKLGHNEINVPVPCCDKAWEARDSVAASKYLAKEGVLPLFTTTLEYVMRLKTAPRMRTMPSSNFLKALIMLSLRRNIDRY